MKKTWVMNHPLGATDIAMSHSLEYLHEAFLRFGHECPLSGDDKTHALANSKR